MRMTREQNVNRISRFFPIPKAAPHSPRRQKLNLRMKSLSLDSPESTELHGRGRRYPPSASVYHHGGSGGQLEHSTPPSNNSRLHCKLFNLRSCEVITQAKAISPPQRLRVPPTSGSFCTRIEVSSQVPWTCPTR